MHPPGPFPPAHLDACHEDPALEPPRWRVRAQLFTRPAADAGPWRRAARALPACERGMGREGFGAGAAAGGEERRRRRGEGPPGHAQGRLWGGWGRCAGGGGACLGSSVGPVRGRARRGGEEGEARSAVLYWGSLTVPRAKAAGTRGRGVPGDGAWHWDVRAPDTVSTPPIGSARALSSGASHPAPSPWVELGSTQGVVWCGVVWCGVVWCGVVWCGVVWCGVVWCGVVWCGVVWCGVVWCAEGAVTKRQRPGCLPTGTGKRAGLCVLCARCV